MRCAASICSTMNWLTLRCRLTSSIRMGSSVVSSSSPAGPRTSLSRPKRLTSVAHIGLDIARHIVFAVTS